MPALFICARGSLQIGPNMQEHVITIKTEEEKETNTLENLT